MRWVGGWGWVDRYMWVCDLNQKEEKKTIFLEKNVEFFRKSSGLFAMLDDYYNSYGWIFGVNKHVFLWMGRMMNDRMYMILAIRIVFLLDINSTRVECDCEVELSELCIYIYIYTHLGKLWYGDIILFVLWMRLWRMLRHVELFMYIFLFKKNWVLKNFSNKNCFAY